MPQVLLLLLSVSIVLVIGTIRPTLHSDELPHDLLRPKVVLSWSRRIPLDLEIVLVKDGSKLAEASVLIKEHRERHLQDLIDHAYVTEDVIQILDDRGRQLLVTRFDIVERFDLASMVRHEIVLAFGRLQTLSSFGSHSHLLASSVEVWQRGEVFGVIKGDWQLFLFIA